MNELGLCNIIDNIEVKEIYDELIVSSFIDENDTFEYTKSDIKIGIFNKNELLSVMTFNKIENNNYEIINFSTKININIPNGHYLIFKHFIYRYSPISVFIYFDKSWNNDKIYKDLGFIFCCRIDPKYFLVKNGCRTNNGYKVFDSGQSKLTNYIF